MVVKVCTCVCVFDGGGGGFLPWCLAPNGIRGERQRKGDKVKLRCCQLWLTTSGPNSRGTGALSRHRSHSPFTPLCLSTHPFQLIFLSFYCSFLLILLPPQTLLLSTLCDAATMGWTFFKVYFTSIKSKWKQKEGFNPQSGDVCYPPFACFL